MRAKEMMDSVITVKGKIFSVIYKKDNFSAGDFAVFRFECSSIDGELPDEIKASYCGLLTFTGAAPSLSTKVDYEIMLCNPPSLIEGLIGESTSMIE